MTRLLSSFSTPYRGFPVPGARSSLRGAAWGTPRPIYVLGPALLPRLRATRALLSRPPSSTRAATDGWMAMFGAKEARGEATRLLCLIWPPACVLGYPWGLRNAVLPGITRPWRLLRVVISTCSKSALRVLSQGANRSRPVLGRTRPTTATPRAQ